MRDQSLKPPGNSRLDNVNCRQDAKSRDSILREKRDLQLRLRGEEPEDDARPRIVIPRGVSPKEYLRLKTEAEELGLPYRVEYTPRQNLANTGADASQDEGEDG